MMNMRFETKSIAESMSIRTFRKHHIAIHVMRDIAVLILSVLVAIWIVQGDVVKQLESALGLFSLVAVFVAGFFFTSMLTVAPATAALAGFSQDMPVLLVALVGGVGAVLADAIVFKLFRDHIGEDVAIVMRTLKIRGFAHFRRSTVARRTLSIIGAILIATPLPNEIGVSLLGASRLSSKTFVLIVFALNSFGILLVGLAARTL